MVLNLKLSDTLLKWPPVRVLRMMVLQGDLDAQLTKASKDIRSRFGKE